jgi:hypothetical protein
VLENKGSCRYILALFLAQEETELSWNRSYLGYIERCVNVIVKLDYNIKVSALRLKELYRFSFDCSDFGLPCSHLDRVAVVVGYGIWNWESGGIDYIE